MLAFDETNEVLKPEFPLSDSTSEFLGFRPNPSDDVMELEQLLFGINGLDQFDSQFLAASDGSDVTGSATDREESATGELIDTFLSNDPMHRTDCRDPHHKLADDEEEDTADKCAGRSESEANLFPRNISADDRSNRATDPREDHDYDVRSSPDRDLNESGDEDDDGQDEDVDEDGDDGLDEEDGEAESLPMTRFRSGARIHQNANGMAAAGTLPSGTGASKRSGLRPHPTRKRCLSTSSTTSLEPGPSKKKRKPSGSSTMSRAASLSAEKSMSRNAIAARENRERKKAQFRELEDRVSELEEENDRLKKDNECKAKSNAALLLEVKYLQGVVQNTPEIASLIGCIRKTTGIKEIRTSLGSNLKSRGAGHKIQDENETPISSTGKSRCRAMRPSGKTASQTGEKAGICLHVVDGSVSVEFCASCSKKANRSLNS